MNRRYIFPILLGLIGAGILVGLGDWQVHRLHWKQAMLADISARIAAAPLPLPATPDPVRDQYLAVTVRGSVEPQELHVLTSDSDVGPGSRVISPFVTAEGRRVMVDRGFVSEARATAPRAGFATMLVGNLQWPNETDSFTPPPDLKGNVWFARDVVKMAAALKTEPVLIVVRSASGESPAITPIPVDTSGIRNEHLNYAITWFSLAFCWLGMTGLLLWRIRRKQL